VPDGLRPDPPLSARARAARIASRRRGVLTLAAALLVIVAGAALVSRLPAGSLPSAAQGPTPTPPPSDRPVSVTVGAEPQTIRLDAADSAALLDMPDEPVDLQIAVIQTPGQGMSIVSLFRNDGGLLVSFDPGQTRSLRLALAAPSGPLRLRLDAGGTGELSLSVAAEALPAGAIPLEVLDVPPGKVAVTLPDGLTGVMGTGLAAGQWVDIYATIRFEDADSEFQNPLGVETPDPGAASQVTTRRLTEAAPVLAVAEGSVTLAVSPQDAAALTWALEARMPFTLIPVAEPSATPAGVAPVIATPALPAGQVAVALAAWQATVIGGELALNRPVDVYLTFMVVDVDEEFQAPLATPPTAAGTTIASPLLGIQGGVSAPDGTPQITTQRMIEGATVIGIENGMITLAVSPEQAAVLMWAIEAQVPAILIPLAED
jgi:hypothetical protein